MCACTPLPFTTTAMEEEESGWKFIHGDVFRFPPRRALLAAFVGTGTQVGANAVPCWCVSMGGAWASGGMSCWLYDFRVQVLAPQQRSDNDT